MRMFKKRLDFDDEKYTYEYFCQDNVCRLCWSATNSIKSFENNSTSAEQILEYTGIDVTTGTPNKACDICRNKIKNFINFKKCCQEAERKLKTIISKTFKENHLTVLRNEVDFDLKVQTGEVKKDKNERQVVKKKRYSSLEIADPIDNHNDLPKDDNYCYVCNLNLDCKEQLTKHKKNCSYECSEYKKQFTNNDLDELLHEYINKFNCDVCQKKFSTHELLQLHKSEHEDSVTNKLSKYECIKCSMIFKTDAILRKHIHTHKKVTKVDNKKEKSVCEVCGQVFSKTSIYVHMLIHTNYKELKCPHCDYRATQQTSLNTHIKLHTGERPFACDQCPYRCVTSSNLNKHRKSHTGVKEFTCHICKKGYRHNVSLRDHITSTHQGDKKHKCKQCDAQYFYFKGLRKHMLVKHGKKVKKVKDDFIEVDRESYTRMKKGRFKVEDSTGYGEAGTGHGDAEMDLE